MVVIDILVIVFSVFLLAYFQASAVLSVTLMTLVLIAITLSTSGYFLLLTFFWFLFLMTACFMLFSKLRQRFITDAIIARFQNKMPTISETERDAIEAGDTWWEKELFSGRPAWKKLFNTARPTLQPAEQAFLDTQVNTLCNMLDDWRVVSEHDLSQPVWEYLKQQHFFGMMIPKEYGGLGFSAQAHSAVVTRIATKSMSAAISVMVPNSLGPAELLQHYGTDEQKSYYLPRLASGQDIPCFALTAPEAGSDAGAIPDSGVVCRGMHEGQEIIGVRLNWDKRYITLAPVATVIGLAFRLFDPENLLGMGRAPGITLCLVPASHPGVQNEGRRHNPMHLAFMNGPTRGKNVFIPLDWIIGGPNKIGKGWRMLMECLSIGRGISLPALSTGGGQMIYRMTGAYARLRRQFNVPIASFEGVSEALGYISGLTYMMEACRLLTASAVAQNIRPATTSAITKYQLTEMARKVISHAMDVHGGHAIQVGPENFLGHAHMAAPISITVEGANILTRNLIIFGQGAIRCHPFLLKEVQQFTAPPSPERAKKLDKLIFAHTGYVISLAVRNIWLGLTGGRLLISPKKGRVAKYYRQLTRMSAALALLSDITLMLLGGELKRKERISARLGDILGQLYLASAVLKYFEDQGQPNSDYLYVEWCVKYCLANIQQSIDELVDNYPLPWVGKLLRMVIFPFGKAYRMPSDKLHAKIAASMLEPSVLRDRLTHLVYKSDSPKSPQGRLDMALRQVEHVEPMLKKMQKALKQGVLERTASFDQQLRQAIRIHLITEEEAEKWHEYYALYLEIIKVDEFSLNFNSVLTREPSEWKEEAV